MSFPELLEDRIAPAIFTVTTLSDLPKVSSDGFSGSLPSMILAANNLGGSNTIQFAPGIAHGTLMLHFGLPAIASNLTITGPATGVFTIDGGHKTQLLAIQEAGQTNPLAVELDNLRFAHGMSENGGGLAINDLNGTVTLKDCVVTGNIALGVPGLSNSVYGGGIAVYGGSLTMRHGQVTNNSAIGGSGGVGDATHTGGVGGGATGGGIFISSNGTADLDSVFFGGNKAIGGIGGSGFNGANGAKGAAGQQGGSGASGTDGGSGGEAAGGAVYSAGNTTLNGVQITKSIVTGGSGAKGGHGGNGGANAGNGADGGYGGYGGVAFGAGVASISDSTLTLENSTLWLNTAAGGAGGKGGAPGKPGAGTVLQGGVKVKGSTGQAGFSPTKAHGLGGGLYAISAQVTLIENTIGQNTATNGGGLYIASPESNSFIDNCTIAFNKSTGDSGASGLYVTHGAGLSVNSTIIAENQVKDAVYDIHDAGPTAESLYGAADPATPISLGTGDLQGNPLLGKLGVHGGDVGALVYVPSLNGPAIDNGFNPFGVPTDQRDLPRENGNGQTDIGAVQADQST